jgi:hypothetical protein
VIFVKIGNPRWPPPQKIVKDGTPWGNEYKWFIKKLQIMKLIFINHLIYMLCSIKMFNGEIENYDKS